MDDEYIRFHDVSFTYDTMTSPLIERLSFDLARGWTGIIGANGAGKTTILKLATGEISPQKGSITCSGNAIYCRQRTDEMPLLLNELLVSTDSDAYRIRGQLGLGSDWHDRWDTLSHGERKRAQIAVALWHKPGVLAIDEPTNHLDSYAGGLLYHSLEAYKGVGLLVSHDRDLLDNLCYQCLFVDPPKAILRPGNYTSGSLQAISDEEYMRNQYALKKQNMVKMKKEASKRRNIAGRSHHMRSKRGLAIKDHDARFKRNRARISGKDGTGGKLLNQMKGRIRQAQEELKGIKVRKKYEKGIWVTGSKSKRDFLFRLPNGMIHLGGNRHLYFPELVMSPDDRIALTGQNGGGKSSLVRYILKILDIPRNRLAYIPQEIDQASSKEIMSRALELSSERLGKMMVVVSRLGSRPQRLLESRQPSPGETRKLLLATGIANEPHLIVMDEPTNHMDLPSIECLEKALEDCPCGMLLVSHDRWFLEKLTNRHWHISPREGSSNDFLLQDL
jgi:ATPase subunit of ABC transporter with duplicated ATPase domains